QGGGGRAGAGLYRSHAGLEARGGRGAGLGDRARGSRRGESGQVEQPVLWRRTGLLVRLVPLLRTLCEGHVLPRWLAETAAARDLEVSRGALLPCSRR